MADAIRRILWLIPVLSVGAVLIFFVLGSTSTISDELRQPLFYNPAPESAEVAAKRALRLIEAGDPEGTEKLTELGGAALPLILAELPTMAVEEQRRLAHALRPLAERMRLSERSAFAGIEPRPTSSGASASPLREESDRQLLFWERYRDEHALDLRPLSASRLVRRMAERDAHLRSADLLAIDTYALPTLVGALGRVSTQDDVDRCRRVVRVIAHVTGKPWRLDPGATPEQARKLATKIRKYWDQEGGRFTQMERLELLVARFSQTEFGSWVFRSVRQLTGLDHPELLARILSQGRSSAGLLALCLVGLLLVGPAVAATIQVVQLRSRRFQFEYVGLRTAMAGATMTVIAWSVAEPESSFAYLGGIALLVGTVFSTFILQRELSDRVDWRTHHVLRSRTRLSRVLAVTRWLTPSIPTLTPIAIAEAALWVTCLEASSETQGLGREMLRALLSGDLDFLMAICLGLGLATGLAQVAADVFLGNVRTRLGER